MRSTQRPTETPVTSPNDGVRYEHPAFGQIGASRVQGSRRLYGTDFVHRAFVRVHISTSQMTRMLSRDWHFAPDEIVSVDLSEAQWATFVSSLNVGQGVPCTIDRRDGRPVPGIELATRRDEQFKAEVADVLTEARAEIAAAVAEVNAAAIPKVKRESILRRLAKAAQHLASNLSFVTDQFDKHVETTVEHAKIEVNAYLTHAVTMAGLDALRLGDAAEPMIEIEDRREPAPREKEAK